MVIISCAHSPLTTVVIISCWAHTGPYYGYNFLCTFSSNYCGYHFLFTLSSNYCGYHFLCTLSSNYYGVHFLCTLSSNYHGFHFLCTHRSMPCPGLLLRALHLSLPMTTPTPLRVRVPLGTRSLDKCVDVLFHMLACAK